MTWQGDQATSADAKRELLDAILLAWVREPRKNLLTVLGEHLGAPASPITDRDLFEAVARSAPRARPARSAPRKVIASDEDADLAGFAAEVNALARRLPPWGPGAGKVYISSIWEERTRLRSPYAHRGIEAFKARLVQANQRGFLDLSRADLVEAMDRRSLDISEIDSLGTTFHFVRVRE